MQKKKCGHRTLRDRQGSPIAAEISIHVNQTNAKSSEWLDYVIMSMVAWNSKRDASTATHRTCPLATISRGMDTLSSPSCKYADDDPGECGNRKAPNTSIRLSCLELMGRWWVMVDDDEV